jgi:hypothetical protein
VQQKDKRVAQHESQCNDSNTTVAAMVTAMAAAMMAIILAVVVAMTMAATAMAGGSDNNQLKAAAEEMAAEVTETAMSTEMTMRRHS